MHFERKESRSSLTDQLDRDGAASQEDDPPEPVNILREEARFDEIIVWGHDSIPAADDSFAKGIEEWISFAEAVSNLSPIYQLALLTLICVDSRPRT